MDECFDNFQEAFDGSHIMEYVKVWFTVFLFLAWMLKTTFRIQYE